VAEEKLLPSVFQQLVKKGASIIMIEHNLRMLAQADYLIELGPFGGDRGGECLAIGSVGEIKENPRSRIGRYL
jgi:excinuclease ABC subunit A